MKKTTAATPANIIQALEGPFAEWFQGDSWGGWKAILRGAYALPMSDSEIDFFKTVAHRDPPTERVRQLFIAAGRRAGKDSTTSAIAAYTAATFEGMPKRRGIVQRLRRGERATILCIGVDKLQATIQLNYIKSYFAHIPQLAEMVERETRDGLELKNNTEIIVATNNYRTVRGRAILLAILSECAFYQDQESANPDTELYNAIMPGLATLPNSMLIAISSPYKKSGLLYDKFRKNFGQPGDVLFVRAATRLLNPTIGQDVVDRALAEDNAAAQSEWLGNFRDDISSYVTQEVLDRCVIRGRTSLPPVRGEKYFAFTDPSGGASDSMVLVICHRSTLSDAVVVDAIAERRAPFSPDQVVAEFAATLGVYNITKVRGDRYGGEWPAERFRSYGIGYQTSNLTKAEIYLNALPLLTAGKCELLDNARLENQFKGLERRPSRGGKELIDHAPGGHDDVANAVCGSLLMPAQSQRAKVKWNAVSVKFWGDDDRDQPYRQVG